MARMIPGCPDENAPAGERDVFNMLASAPDDWVILHSLDLAPWRDSKRTEIDFVVIIPDAGILCIEVKSHGTIEFTDGRWLPPTIRKSPFKQALDARFALQRRLCDVAEYARSIPFGAVCIFPNASFVLTPNLSVSPRDLMDVDTFRGFRTAEDFAGDLRRRLLEGADAEGRQRVPSALPPLRVDNVVSLCIPVQRRRPDAGEEIRRRYREVENLLQAQQKPVLELATLNRRLLITGGAGTGKTLIAMELAQRCSEIGERVALVCFNRMIGCWMRDQLEARHCGPNVVVDSASRLLVRLAGVYVPPDAEERFWSEGVPMVVEERLTDPEFNCEAQFDVLVVDEAQDILARPALWNCLLALLKGGVAKGRFVLFGDIEHQVLKKKHVMNYMLAELEAQTDFTRCRMSENCRNPRPVAEAALMLAGLPSSVYSAYLRTGSGATDVSIVPCDGEVEAIQQVRNAINQARARGFKDRDISLLSFAADQHSMARKLLVQGMRLMPAERAEDQIGYASVYAFKGMENGVIIVTDTRVDQGELGRSLFYTALTRATGQAIVLCTKEDAGVLGGWIAGGVS